MTFMSKKAKWIIICLAVVLALELVAAGGIAFYLKPWKKAASTMPETGTMVLTRSPSGELVLTWPEGMEQDRYRVRVTKGDDLLMQIWVREESCTLENLPEDVNLAIVISSARGYRYPFVKEEQIRLGQRDLKAIVNLQNPTVENLTYTADPENMTVQLQFDLDDNSVCRMYRVEQNGELTQLQSLEEGYATVQLGENGDFPVPVGDEKLTFAFDAYRFSPGAVYYGTVSEQLSIVREDLLQRDLALEHTDLGNNVHRFAWGETKGDYYEVQQFDAATESWQALKRVELEEERSYTTGHLPRYSDLRFRVVAVGGQTMPDSEYAAISEEVSITTGTTAVFSTVWPIQELKLYSDAAKTEVIGKAKAVNALCVLDEQDGLFRVRVDGQEGYVDSNYCLINLPEYLGDLCLYRITNSNSSMFMVHEYEIPTVTGRVLLGYERVQQRRDQQLVPLLYPVAKRLEKAAQSAIAQGYKLKIYDAYRPKKATEALYTQTVALMDQQLPQGSYTGRYVTDLPQLQEGQVLTYGNLMTNFGQYAASNILEEGTSRHNRGVALDLTLVEIATGQELQMQTSVHDLSWYAQTARNNANAKKLASIMKGAGFESLNSEWWHFHDVQAQNSLKPEYQKNGVTPDCWMADDQGWRYRRDDGEYYVNCTQTIDGVSYTFDAQGYLVTE